MLYIFLISVFTTNMLCIAQHTRIQKGLFSTQNPVILNYKRLIGIKIFYLSTTNQIQDFI